MNEWNVEYMTGIRHRVYTAADHPAEILEAMARVLRASEDGSQHETYLLHNIAEDPEYGDWNGDLYTETVPPKEGPQAA